MSGKREFVAVVKNQFTGKALKADKEQRYGAVQFRLNGRKYGKLVRLDAMGRASKTSSKMEPGRYKVTARFIPRDSRAAMYASESFVLNHVVSREKVKGRIRAVLHIASYRNSVGLMPSLCEISLKRRSKPIASSISTRIASEIA